MLLTSMARWKFLTAINTNKNPMQNPGFAGAALASIKVLVCCFGFFSKPRSI